jgi:hypothetical protein
MATTTPNYGWPVPTSTDLVKDGATAIEALGDAIDATLFASGSGLVKISTTTFSAVSSQSFNSIFSSTYDNYKIVVSNLTHSVGGVGVNMRLRKSGTDDSSTNYVRQYVDANGSTLASARPGTDTLWLTLLPSTGTENGFSEMTIFNPNNATIKTAIIGGFPYNGTTLVSQTYYGFHNVATSANYDGFSLIPGSGTISGTVSVYGYSK